MNKESNDSDWYHGGGLAPHWEGFVDCKARTATMKPFLKKVLPADDRSRVIDLGAGIGCEASTLLDLGYKVTANEIAPRFREIAVNRLGQAAERICWTGADWRCLAQYFDSRTYDAALLVGNSLSVLLNEEDRLRAAEQFNSVVDSGGILVIDQRNYDFILENREDILANGFRYSSEVVYCEDTVLGRPRKITEDLVIFDYLIEKNLERVGSIKMYPFDGREMIDLFECVGFEYQGTYFDLQELRDYDKKPSGHDFETHIFKCT